MARGERGEYALRTLRFRLRRRDNEDRRLLDTVLEDEDLRFICCGAVEDEFNLEEVENQLRAAAAVRAAQPEVPEGERTMHDPLRTSEDELVGGWFQDLLATILNNQDAIMAFIKAIMALFASSQREDA